MSRPTTRAAWSPGAELPPRDLSLQLAMGTAEAAAFPLDWLEDYHRTPAREPDRRARDQVTD